MGGGFDDLSAGWVKMGTLHVAMEREGKTQRTPVSLTLKCSH